MIIVLRKQYISFNCILNSHLCTKIEHAAVVVNRGIIIQFEIAR